MMDHILMYAKYGVDNTGEVEDDLTDSFGKMRMNIDLAVNANNALARKKQINIVFDLLIDPTIILH